MKIDSIKFECVSFMHEGNDPILQNADFEFPMDQIIWLKAEEGMGKSSLLQVMACLQLPQAGKMQINEANVSEMTFEEFLPYRLQIGYSFDYGGLINNKSIFDNLMLPLLYHKILPGEEAKARVNGLLDFFNIKKYSHERPAHVPGRIRKIACLLRALVLQPQVLLLDDPSVGIGQETAEVFADYIHKMRDQGCLRHVFISSYDEKFMGLFSHHIVHLSDGQLYFQQSGNEKRAANL